MLEVGFKDDFHPGHFEMSLKDFHLDQHNIMAIIWASSKQIRLFPFHIHLMSFMKLHKHNANCESCISALVYFYVLTLSFHSPTKINKPTVKELFNASTDMKMWSHAPTPTHISLKFKGLIWYKNCQDPRLVLLAPVHHTTPYPWVRVWHLSRWALVCPALRP